MKRQALLAVIFIAAQFVYGNDDLQKYETWITGDVFARGKLILFRADKPVKGNTTRDVVLLGATKQTYRVLFPMYVRAAEMHAKLRLYGVLLPIMDAKDPNSPSVQFITWKLHAPNEPDELAPRDKIIIGPEDTVSGNKILVHPKQ